MAQKSKSKGVKKNQSKVDANKMSSLKSGEQVNSQKKESVSGAGKLNSGPSKNMETNKYV